MRIARASMCCCVAMLLAACASTSAIQSPNPGTTLQLEDKTLALPATTKIGGTTFGHYAFKATEAGKPSAPPFYGILPLALHKGRLVAGIVLTAPLMLLTKLRGAFGFYEVDAGKRTLRYRDHADDPWIEYRVTPEDEARARAWFDEAAKAAAEEAAEKEREREARATGSP
jgi:hypothetical protein